MIILDTNVLSELMCRAPDSAVLAWLDRQPPLSIWITSITLFECQFGLALMSIGRRRQALETSFAALLAEDLDKRVLAFDTEAAAQAATLAAQRQLAGRPVDIRDTQIAGIAQSRRATVATRNLKHFEGLSVPVVNPWG